MTILGPQPLWKSQKRGHVGIRWQESAEKNKRTQMLTFERKLIESAPYRFTFYRLNLEVITTSAGSLRLTCDAQQSRTAEYRVEK
jgi:hypothetical protein